MSSVQHLTSAHPGFSYIQSRHTFRSLEKKAAQIMRRLQRSGFREKYCGPHAAAMALHFWTRKRNHIEQIYSSFDAAKVCKDGTTAAEMQAGLEKITGVFFSRIGQLQEERVESILSSGRPIMALMKVKEDPEEYHWIAIVGSGNGLYSSLNFGKVELIPKGDFFGACTEIVYPESEEPRKKIKVS